MNGWMDGWMDAITKILRGLVLCYARDWDWDFTEKNRNDWWYG